MPQPQLRYVGIIYSQLLVNTSKRSAQPRHYLSSSKDNEAFQSRYSDPDPSRLDRSRNSGNGTGYVYVDKFSRDDHMKVDSPYSSREQYEVPGRPQDLVNRTSSHNDSITRGPIPPASLPRSRESMNAIPASPITPASTIVEKPHRHSRDRSPRHHHDTRQISKQPSLAPISTTQTGPPQDRQLVEDHRHRGRRIDRDREVCAPSVLIRPVGLIPFCSPLSGPFSHSAETPAKPSGCEISINWEI